MDRPVISPLLCGLIFLFFLFCFFLFSNSIARKSFSLTLAKLGGSLCVYRSKVFPTIFGLFWAAPCLSTCVLLLPFLVLFTPFFFRSHRHHDATGSADTTSCPSPLPGPILISFSCMILPVLFVDAARPGSQFFYVRWICRPSESNNGLGRQFFPVGTRRF